MFFWNESPLEDFFPEENNVLEVNETPNDMRRQYFEFIPFHPVSTTSEMVGTTIEELLQHNFPTKNSWENSRFARYPEEIVIRLNHRSEIRFILLRAKVDRPIPMVEIYIGDGVYGNFNDTKYLKLTSAKNVTENGTTLKVEGIGNFIKIVFPYGNMKTQSNPFGQVSLAQLKFFGKKVNHLLYFNEGVPHLEDEKKNNDIDQLLIQMGLPITDEYNLVQDQNYEIAPVDEETKITIHDLLLICRRAEKSKDYEILRKIKKDIRQAFYLGNEILNVDRELAFAKSKEDFDRCIELRKKRDLLSAKRDNIDVIYETSRYEKMILLREPNVEDLLKDEENRRILEMEKRERERLELEERERRRRELDERERRLKEREDELNRQRPKPAPAPIPKEDNIKPSNIHKEVFHNSSIITSKRKNKFDETEYVNPREKQKKEQFLDELQYNQGDKDLEPFFVPRAKNAGGNIQSPDINKLRRALRMGMLTCTGVRLYSALIGDDWKMREAAVRAFLEFIENPLPSRYLYKSFPLFQTCIEICKLTCDDKVVQIFIEGLKLLKTCLAPPVCGNDVEPNFIQKSIRYFLPIYIKKISEFNDKQRDLTLRTIIDIFRHPALNVGDLVKACLDIVENNDGVTPDKQPWNVLLARLEIILHILDEYGINEKLWDWYNVFVELIVPSLFHQKPDCRITAEEICVVLYKFVGSDIRNIINGLNNIKPNLKERLNNKFNEIDISINRESQAAGQLNNLQNDLKGIDSGNKNDNLEPIIESEKGEDIKSFNS
jgi:hypothetical protein